MIRWECYIEEYESENRLCARLRDKKSNKKISLQINSLEEKNHFLQFLSAAKDNEKLPTIFDQDGDDIVVVYGVKQNENRNTIFIDITGGGYSFE